MASHQGAAQKIRTGPRLTGTVPAHPSLPAGSGPAARRAHAAERVHAAERIHAAERVHGAERVHAAERVHGAERAHGAEGVQRTRRILIVDDEPNIRSFIGRALSAAGYLTGFAGSGSEGLRHALDEHYDLVLLDLVMPDMDGCDVLDQLLRARPDQTVMVLSCVTDVATKVDCLERGARDYLTKPFSLAELLVRIRVRLREDAHQRGEARPGEAAGEIIRAGNLTLDVARLVADIGHGPVPLTRLEFLLLRELAEHFGQSVRKGRLLASVWGYDFDPGSNVVDVCVRRLRSKLGFSLIKTVRGEGYQLADG
jgi:DNA-binding response OmpR family regulator